MNSTISEDEIDKKINEKCHIKLSCDLEIKRKKHKNHKLKKILKNQTIKER